MALIACTHSVAIIAMFSVLFMQYTDAAIVVQGTRMVFPADVDHVTVRLSNSSGEPVLVQS